MVKVTALRQAGENRVRVYLDGKAVLTLHPDAAAKAGIRVGQELDENGLQAVISGDSDRRCLDAASRFLAYRPRSEQELRTRLRQRGFSTGDIESTIERLKKGKLIDDAAFARFWKENRDIFRPRSWRVTRLELKQKGVAEETVKAITAEIDDSDAAYRAALARGQRLTLGDFENFRQRLGGYLRRRGFDYDDINTSVKRVWKELGGQEQL